MIMSVRSNATVYFHSTYAHAVRAVPPPLAKINSPLDTTHINIRCCHIAAAAAIDFCRHVAHLRKVRQRLLPSILSSILLAGNTTETKHLNKEIQYVRLLLHFLKMPRFSSSSHLHGAETFSSNSSTTTTTRFIIYIRRQQQTA